MEKVLVLNASPRKDGNSDMLCSSFKKGAEENGNEVEIIFLREKRVEYCSACDACKTLGKCVKNDDMAEIEAKIKAADAVVWATPEYFRGISAQLKTVIDRMYSFRTEVTADLIYFITVMSKRNINDEPALNSMRDVLTRCLPQCRERGVILADGVNERGEVVKTKAYTAAYELGKSI